MPLRSASSQRLRRLASARTLVVSTFAVLVAGFCAVAGVMLVDLRQDARREALKGANNLLAAVSQDIDRNVDVFDLSLRAVQDGLALPRLAELDTAMRQAVLFDRAATAEYLGAILVLNEKGDVVEDAGADPPRRGNFADREYFRVQRDRADAGLFMSAPFRRQLTGPGDYVVALSRRLSHADGSFAGVVVGTLRLDYFRNLFDRFSLGSKGVVNLFRSDGAVLLRTPYEEALVGKDSSRSNNFQRYAATYAGEFEKVTALDGVRRVYTFTHVGRTPLILAIELATEDIYASWRHRAEGIVLALAVLCAATTCLGVGLLQELGRRAHAEAATRESESRYRLLADHATDVILRLSPAMVRTYVSPSCREVFGFLPEELVGKLARGSIHPDDLPDLADEVATAQHNRSNLQLTYRVRHRDGQYVFVEGHYSFLPEDGGFIVVLRDVTARRHAEEQLAAAHAELVHLAATDGLTRLANRRRFDEVIQAEWRRAAREGLPLSLLLLDVDRFKLFNDRYGHQPGDECLRAVAGAVASCGERPADLVARYGGEEFAVLLPGTDEAGAAVLAARVLAAVAGLRLPHQDNLEHGGIVTASVGSATVIPPSPRSLGYRTIQDLQGLIAAADGALYEAKRLGRNRAVAQDHLQLQCPPTITGSVEDVVADLHQAA